MPKETPKYKSLLEAYEWATGIEVEEPKGPTYEIPWGEQLQRWYKKNQAAYKNEQTSE